MAMRCGLASTMRWRVESGIVTEALQTVQAKFVKERQSAEKRFQDAKSNADMAQKLFDKVLSGEEEGPVVTSQKDAPIRKTHAPKRAKTGGMKSPIAVDSEDEVPSAASVPTSRAIRKRAKVSYKDDQEDFSEQSDSE